METCDAIGPVEPRNIRNVRPDLANKKVRYPEDMANIGNVDPSTTIIMPLSLKQIGSTEKN